MRRSAEERDLAAIAREQFLRGNRLNLLIDGQATFEAILAEIAGARICILCNSISREDGLGLRLWKPWPPARQTASRSCFSDQKRRDDPCRNG